MNNLIITTRQSPVRLLVDYVATTILWTLFALFIFLFAMDLLTGYYWQSEARSRLQFYFLLAVANAVVLIVWALYNKLRFQKQQHHAAYQYTPQEYAESLAIPDELYQQLQKSHRMSVHFTSQGQIKMVVSEKALVRAHPKQSPVRPGSAPIIHLTVCMQRTLAKCRTYAILFSEPDDPNHFIFFETFQRVT